MQSPVSAGRPQRLASCAARCGERAARVPQVAERAWHSGPCSDAALGALLRQLHALLLLLLGPLQRLLDQVSAPAAPLPGRGACLRLPQPAGAAAVSPWRPRRLQERTAAHCSSAAQRRSARDWCGACAPGPERPRRAWRAARAGRDLGRAAGERARRRLRLAAQPAGRARGRADAGPAAAALRRCAWARGETCLQRLGNQRWLVATDRLRRTRSA